MLFFTTWCAIWSAAWSMSAREAPPAWMLELLENRNRIHSAPTFAPDGLYLAGIGYDPKWAIPHLSRMPNFAFG